MALFKFLFIILYLQLLAVTTVLAVEPLKFKNISIDQGLSHTTVFDLLQDKGGNLWIATADGLNKYDSYLFTIYRHRHNDTLSLADNMIRCLKNDSSGLLWIGTMGGLSQYDASKNCFYNYTFIEEGEKIQIWDIEEIDPQRLILATNKGVRIFNKEEKALEAKSFLPHLHAMALTCMDRQILVGTREGIYLYTPGSNHISPIVRDLQSFTINTIQYIPYKGFWVGTEGQGLYFIDKNFLIRKSYRHAHPQPEQRISSDFVRALCLDQEQRLWVGTFVGLNVYNAITESFDIYNHDNEDPASISQNSIRTIFADNQGGIWLGTYFCGLDYQHPLQNRFGLIRQSLKPNSLKDNVISCITEDPSSGDLWIGTNDDGVSYYSTRTRQFSYFRSSEKQSNRLKSNNIKCILPDAEGNAWAGTHGGGLSYIRKTTGQIETYTTKNSDLLNDNVYAILRVSPEEPLWVGTLEGIQLFDPSKRKFSPHFLSRLWPEISKSPVFYLYKDSQEQIWVGTHNSIVVYNPRSGQIETKLSKQPEKTIGQVLCIYESRNGYIWAGTRYGLYQLTKDSDSTRLYTTSDGLPNDVIYGILEDSYGRLWLSTNKGLSCFDVKNNVFRTYTKSDGIQSDQFNNYSFCKTSTGMFYFGGVDGITYFMPENLQDNPFTPNAVLSRLTLFNREVEPGDATGILTQSLDQTSYLKFKADQNFFRLYFSAPNFLSARKNIFQYKLEGFDKDWYVTDKPQVSYSNLSPGIYTFKVNVANNDGKWSPQTTTLEIEILPVWYYSWWAKGFFLLLLLSIGYAAFNYYKARLRLTKNEEMNQMKIRFFVNITHELRTPLTLILSPIQEIMQKGVSDKWLRGQIEYIQRSANRLLNLVNQTLDYRRAELGVFGLKVYNHAAETVTHDIFMLFYKFARQKNISYEFISDLGGQLYPLDINYLERILLNLLSNAFKYTPDGGRISLTVREEKQKLILEVSDTGCGIAKEEQQKIFERFYQINKDQMSSGIGLSLVKVLAERHHGHIFLHSTPGEGSVFQIELPADPAAYPPGEWDSNGSVSKDIPLGMSDLVETDTTTIRLTPPTEKPSGTILIINDEESITTYLSENLSSQFRVLTAPTVEKAMTLLKEEKIDIVVIDTMMQGMDGMKLCKTIKQNISTSHIFALLLTRGNDSESELEALRYGADGVLPKPFTYNLLNAKIHHLLKVRKRLENFILSEKSLKPEAVGFNAADEELLKKCQAIVEKNLDQIDFSVDDLSRAMGMSRSTLHLKLKSITGESTIDFIRKIKFDRACQLLQEGRYTIAEISTMVGFSTPSYFTGSFKKQMGCLPTEYLKKKAQ